MILSAWYSLLIHWTLNLIYYAWDTLGKCIAHNKNTSGILHELKIVLRDIDWITRLTCVIYLYMPEKAALEHYSFLDMDKYVYCQIHIYPFLKNEWACFVNCLKPEHEERPFS